MGLILLAALSLVASVSGFAKVTTSYHSDIGIPAAKKLKEIEDKIIAEPSPRIVGGEVAAVGAHPYLAGLIATLVNSPIASVCGSTLLSPNRLVTAAHCWYDGSFQAQKFTAVLGSRFLFSGGIRIPTASVVTHPFWNPWTLDNDVAMVALPRDLSYSPLIQPASLPYNMLWNSFAGQWAVAAGFGKQSDLESAVPSDTTTRHVKLRVISVPECQWSYGLIVKFSNLCTSGQGGVGVCGGDSGGPLVIYSNGKPVLIGISSFAAFNGCHLGMPSGFTRVTSFLDFISSNM